MSRCGLLEELRYVKAPLFIASFLPLIWAWLRSGLGRPALFADSMIFVASSQLLMNLEMDRRDMERGLPPVNCSALVAVGPCEYRCGELRLARRASATLAALTALAALLITRSLILVLVGLAAVALMAAYLLRPIELYRRGLGEVSTFMDFGPLLVYGAIVAFGGSWGLRPALASVAFGLAASLLRFRHHLGEEEGFRRRHSTAITLALAAAATAAAGAYSLKSLAVVLPASALYILAIRRGKEGSLYLIYYAVVAAAIFLG